MLGMQLPGSSNDWRYKVGWMEDALIRNRDKVFVDRILNPGQYPTMKEDGYDVTHKMAYSSFTGSDGKRMYRVYPTVLFEDGQLTDYSKDGDTAFERASATGEYIDFESAKKASEFSKNYKKMWGKTIKPEE